MASSISKISLIHKLESGFIAISGPGAAVESLIIVDTNTTDLEEMYEDLQYCIATESLNCVTVGVEHSANNIPEVVTTVEENHNRHCPICLCPFQTPNSEIEQLTCSCILLSCSDMYCVDCFHSWIRGSGTGNFPLKCLAENCNELIDMKVIRTYMKDQDLEQFLRSAVDHYIVKTNVCSVLSGANMYRCIWDS
jgi:hypothetical protein